MSAQCEPVTPAPVGCTRQARTVRRRNPTRRRVTERDRSFLLALARTRYLSTSLIARLLFHGSRQIANRRARTLLDLGLIRCWVTALNNDNIYGLTLAGRRALEDAADDDIPETIQCPRELDAQWAHALAINTVRVRLAVDLERTGAALCWWRSNRELRAGGRHATIPDALFAIEWSADVERVYALEVEYHTRAPHSLLRKVARYTAASYHPGGIYGERGPVVLVVGHDPIWLERYRGATARLGMPITIGFTTLADVDNAGPIAAIWRTPLDDGKHGLRELGNRSYRNYSLMPETLDQSSAIVAGRTHNSEITEPIEDIGQQSS